MIAECTECGPKSCYDGQMVSFVPRPIASVPGDPFGTHRATEPLGALPQPAWRVSNDFAHLYTGEMLIDVETLNVDAASFRQMEEASAGNPGAIAELVKKTVADRGKQHNPVTGSGGMLLGRVLQLAPKRPAGETIRVGDRIATLTSLSLTPLNIRAIKDIRPASAQIDVEGEAVLFATAPFAKLPVDMAERLAVAAMDVAGAAPQVARLVKPGAVVVVLGAGGKSGILCAAEARRMGGASATVIGIESHIPYAKDLEALGICTAVLSIDARDPVRVRQAVLAASGGKEADVTLSCVNVEGAEMSAILVTRDRGTAYFFAMSTSFTAAALGAEGVGKDVDLVIGNGYAIGHAEHTLALLRDQKAIRELFEKRYQ
jgi:L-erythro-3,5-diaminohexanoate dehydrogenase